MIVDLIDQNTFLQTDYFHSCICVKVIRMQVTAGTGRLCSRNRTAVRLHGVRLHRYAMRTHKIPVYFQP